MIWSMKWYLKMRKLFLSWLLLSMGGRILKKKKISTGWKLTDIMTLWIFELKILLLRKSSKSFKNLIYTIFFFFSSNFFMFYSVYYYNVHKWVTRWLFSKAFSSIKFKKIKLFWTIIRKQEELQKTSTNNVLDSFLLPISV